ncbi:MAG: hypothetical protein JNM43_19795 [Planctomycetaceae bacterium]|nr:hypothetical protein [Planctomycetaceae bacterium]
MKRSMVFSGFASILMTAFAIPAYCCDCQTAHAVMGGLPTFGGFSVVHPAMSPYAHPVAEYPLSPTPTGTIGQTYSRPSHPVPDDEHPRTGMLAIRDGGTVPWMSVQNMGGIKMKSGVWLFESNRPLDPGASQIVRVEARHNEKDIEPYQTKFVRLIPGRIVYLDF